MEWAWTPPKSTLPLKVSPVIGHWRGSITTKLFEGSDMAVVWFYVGLRLCGFSKLFGEWDI